MILGIPQLAGIILAMGGMAALNALINWGQMGSKQRQELEVMKKSIEAAKAQQREQTAASAMLLDKQEKRIAEERERQKAEMPEQMLMQSMFQQLSPSGPSTSSMMGQAALQQGAVASGPTSVQEALSLSRALGGG